MVPMALKPAAMEEQAPLAEGPGVVFREVQEEVVGLGVPGFNQNVVLQYLTLMIPDPNDSRVFTFCELTS